MLFVYIYVELEELKWVWFTASVTKLIIGSDIQIN